jgi:pimeloyl-ACP methyl ester carboxylesterase
LAHFQGNAAARIDFASVKPVKEFRAKTPDGVNISVQEWGNADGPEIIFIHGFLQSHLSWWKQVTDSMLAGKFRVITFDLPGHGGSDKPCDPAIFNTGAHYADTLHAVISASGLKKAVLVGWSYGTRVVCDYLTKYGDSHIGGINFVGSAVSSDPNLRGSVSGFLGGVFADDLVESLKASQNQYREESPNLDYTKIGKFHFTLNQDSRLSVRSIGFDLGPGMVSAPSCSDRFIPSLYKVQDHVQL